MPRPAPFTGLSSPPVNEPPTPRQLAEWEAEEDQMREAEFRPIPRFDETDIRAYMQMPDQGPLRDIDDFASWLSEPEVER